MAWETRGGRSYYYRARKVGGRVVKEYIGAGEVADAIASLDVLDRQRVALRAEEQGRERERLDDLDGAVESFCRAVDAALTNALMQAGYQRHARGQWRRPKSRSRPGTDR